MTAGEGVYAASAVLAVQQSYDNGQTDEFVLPTVVQTPQGQPVAHALAAAMA